MKKRRLEYLSEKFGINCIFIELSSLDEFLIIDEYQKTIIEIRYREMKNDTNDKYISDHTVISTFPLPNEKNIIKDKFFLNTKYTLPDRTVSVSPSDNQKFEEILVKNDNTIVDTNRKFKNKILGFRSKKRSKMIIATLFYICALAFIINFFSDNKEQIKETNANKEVNTKESQSKNENNKSDSPSENNTKTGDSDDEAKQVDKKTTNKIDSKNTKELDENNEEKKELKPGTTDRIPVTLSSTIDGDTAKFNYNGNVEPFRFLLIDTPETKHPKKGEEPYGKEASNRTSQLLKNAKKIEVEFDVGTKKDKYQRNLVYIYVDDQMLNEILVREGLAKVAYVYPPNTRYLDKLELAQSQAKEDAIGIWSIDSAFKENNKQPTNNTVNDNTDYTETEVNDSKNDVNIQEPIQSTESYKNCTELRKVYPNGVPEGHPAYKPKHDRDKDGYACEVN